VLVPWADGAYDFAWMTGRNAVLRLALRIVLIERGVAGSLGGL
jgi:hypothetical protein